MRVVLLMLDPAEPIGTFEALDPGSAEANEKAETGTAMPQFDAIIIGTGQAGPSLARRLAAEGKRVAIIERKRFGGTCVNTGCTPTKTMVASAYAAHLANRAAEYGVMIDGRVSVDMKRVKARKDAVAGQSEKAVERSLRSLDLCTVYTEHARFVSPHEVAVGDEVLKAEWIFVNVGGRAVVPEMPGLDQVEYLTNSSILELDVLPPHLLIIGGSYVGLEFAQVFRRFGSQVTVIEMGQRLIGREDADTSAAIAEILRNEDIDIRLNAECLRVAKRGEGIAVSLECKSGPPESPPDNFPLIGGELADDQTSLDWIAAYRD
jgi:pyruvate/2-oxoglutarate dehydrogenase complex dihydrolipoamide dehydrogenase (E3) component